MKKNHWLEHGWKRKMLQVGISLMMVLCLTANLLLPAADGIGLRTARA